jgi:hypothetical protein
MIHPEPTGPSEELPQPASAAGRGTRPLFASLQVTARAIGRRILTDLRLEAYRASAAGRHAHLAN